MSGAILSMWTLYKNPSDFPGEWVARRFVIGGGKVGPTTDFVSSTDISKVRTHVCAAIRATGQSPVWLDRKADDDPCIMGVWL